MAQAGTDKTEYPHVDGDFLNIGPQCFTNESTDVAGLPSEKHAVISWRGENYYRLEHAPEWWLRELAYQAAGVGSGAVMSQPEGRQIVMPTEEICEGLERLLAEFKKPRNHEEE